MPLGVGAVDPDRHLALAVLARRRRGARSGASSDLGVGGDGVLEVEDQPVAGDRLGLLQRALVGRGHVEHGAAGAEGSIHQDVLRERVVLLLQLGVDLGELLGQLDHHQALLERGVVLHLAVEHHRAGAVAHRLDHATRVRDVLRRRG